MEDSKSSAMEFKKFISKYLYSPLNSTPVIPNQKTREKSTRRTAPKLKVCSTAPCSMARNNYRIKEIQSSVSQSSQVPSDNEIGILSVPDVIDFNLKVLFVGINPGKRSAETGHHFAHHSNHFYPCLVEGGVTNNEDVTYKDDKTLTDRFKIGIINVVNRYTRSSADLSKVELRDGIPSLIQKVKLYKPKILCFIGKCAFDAFEYTVQSNGTIKKSKNFGLQSYQIFWNDNYEIDNGYTKVFVIPSTSARVKHYQKSDKLKYFKELKELMDQ